VRRYLWTLPNSFHHPSDALVDRGLPFGRVGLQFVQPQLGLFLTLAGPEPQPDGTRRSGSGGWPFQFGLGFARLPTQPDGWQLSQFWKQECLNCWYYKTKYNE
jgi:hypothetical protein